MSEREGERVGVHMNECKRGEQRKAQFAIEDLKGAVH